jgi:Cys-Gly metallodipeptidase DUG1
MKLLQHYNYRAAHKATEDVYGMTPDYTREGGKHFFTTTCSVICLLFLFRIGSIPVTLSFATALNVNVLLLPMGRGDDGAHS